MSAHRLLLLCYFYPPLAGGGVHRVLGFTRYLPEHGWPCTVVCAGEEDFWMRDESLEDRVPRDVEVIRVRGSGVLGAWLKVLRRGRGRTPGGWTDRVRGVVDWWLLPDAYTGWAKRVEGAASRALESGRFGAVLSTSPPDSAHLAALGLSRRFGLPWVADFRDPWMGLAYRKPPTPWHAARQAALERSVLSGADVVTAASRTHAGELERRALADGIRRVVHLPNGYDRAPEEGATGGGSASGASAATARDSGTFRLVFTGTLFRTPDTGVFLEALHDFLGPRPDARRRLRVSMLGPFDPGDADRVVALGLSGIVAFEGPRPHHEARERQREADLLLLWKPAATSGRVPGRVYEFLDAGRPLLAVLDPEDETSDIVRRGGGVVVRSGDRAGVAREIARHYEAWQRGAPIAGQRPAWIDEHHRARLAARLAATLDELVEARR